MLNPTKEQIQKRWDELPQVLREAVFSEDNNALLDAISDEFILLSAQSQSLAAIVGNVIFGLTSFAEAEKEIKSELNLESEEAEEIWKRVNEKILLPLKQEIDSLTSTSAPVPIPAGPMPVSPPTVAEQPFVATPEIPSPTGFGSVVQSSAEQAAKAGAPAAAPFVLHKEEEIKPVLGEKKSLGGLFGFVKEPTGQPTFKPATAQIDFGNIPSPAVPSGDKLFSTKKAEPQRIIHYTEAPRGVPVPPAFTPSTLKADTTAPTSVSQERLGGAQPISASVVPPPMPPIPKPMPSSPGVGVKVDYSEASNLADRPVLNSVEQRNLGEAQPAMSDVLSKSPALEKPMSTPVVPSNIPISEVSALKKEIPVSVEGAAASLAPPTFQPASLSAAPTAPKPTPSVTPIPVSSAPPSVGRPLATETKIPSQESVGDDIIDLRTFQIGK